MTDAPQKTLTMSTYHIVMATDDYYAQHAGVCLVSLFENNKYNFTVHIVENNISAENKGKILTVANTYGQTVEFITVNSESFQCFSVTSYYSIATWFRLLLGEILDNSIDRILYVDCDTIICGDIKQLLNIDLQGYPLAAVMDTPWQINQAKEYLRTDKDSAYFNAGIMLIDMKKYRDSAVYEKAVEIIREKTQLPFLDQDILNMIFEKRWLELPCKWNVLNGFLKKEYMTDPRHLAFKEGIRERKIIHYSAKEKPWSWRCMNPLKDYYFKYLERSPWNGFKPKTNLVQRFANMKNSILLALQLREDIFIKDV